MTHPVPLGEEKTDQVSSLIWLQCFPDVKCFRAGLHGMKESWTFHIHFYLGQSCSFAKSKDELSLGVKIFWKTLPRSEGTPPNPFDLRWRTPYQQHLHKQADSHLE